MTPIPAGRCSCEHSIEDHDALGCLHAIDCACHVPVYALTGDDR